MIYWCVLTEINVTLQATTTTTIIITTTTTTTIIIIIIIIIITTTTTIIITTTTTTTIIIIILTTTTTITIIIITNNNNNFIFNLINPPFQSVTNLITSVIDGLQLSNKLRLFFYHRVILSQVQTGDDKLSCGFRSELILFQNQIQTTHTTTYLHSFQVHDEEDFRFPSWALSHIISFWQTFFVCFWIMRRGLVFWADDEALRRWFLKKESKQLHLSMFSKVCIASTACCCKSAIGFIVCSIDSMIITLILALIKLQQTFIKTKHKTMFQMFVLFQANVMSARNHENFDGEFEQSNVHIRRRVASEIGHQQQHPGQYSNNNNNNQPHSSPRIHFLPHQQLSSPAFPVSPILSISPDPSRRYSHQQASSSGRCCWDESLEQLSRELQSICRSGSRDSLSNSTTSSRPSSPSKNTVTLNLSCQPKVKCSTIHFSPSPSHKDNKELDCQSITMRRVSLNIDMFDKETFARLGKIGKGDEKSLKCHRSHEDILENSPPKLLKSILKPSANNQPQESPAAGIETDSPRPPAEETNDQVFDSESCALKPGDFGFPELTMKKIKVRHEETEVSLNRTLAKICRSKNTFLVQKETPDSSTDCSSTQEEDLGSENPIENQLLQLETPVVVVANIQQLFQQKQQQHHVTGELHLEQITETTKGEIEVRGLKIDGTGVEIKSHKDLRREVHQKSVTHVSRFQNSAYESSSAVKRANLVKSSIQAFRQKRFMRLSQGAKSLGKSFENIGIRFKVDLKERNPHSIGVSVDEETGFLTVFATTYSKSVNYDSGFGDTPSVGSSMSDRFGENFSAHKPSISSDTSDASLTPSIEQLHLLRLGESTRPECLRCSIEDGVLRVREIENEAEFLNFDGISTKYLPIMMEDIVNCHITVTLFVPQEFRGAVSVKTIDNILVFSGVKGQFSDRFGSRTSQDVSDDDDGYDAASELSSHSSLTCTPPSMPCLPHQGPSSPVGRGSISSVSSSSQAIPIINPQGNHPPLGAQTFKVALNLPPETITRTIEAWLVDCGQLIVTGKTTGVGRRMTCNFWAQLLELLELSRVTFDSVCQFVFLLSCF